MTEKEKKILHLFNLHDSFLHKKMFYRVVKEVALTTKFHTERLSTKYQHLQKDKDTITNISPEKQPMLYQEAIEDWRLQANHTVYYALESLRGIEALYNFVGERKKLETIKDLKKEHKKLGAFVILKKQTDIIKDIIHHIVTDKYFNVASLETYIKTSDNGNKDDVLRILECLVNGISGIVFKDLDIELY